MSFGGLAIADWGVSGVATTDIDGALIATLKEWLGTYLRQIELERSLGDDFLGTPNSDQISNALTSFEFLDTTLPAVVVTTAIVEKTLRTSRSGSSSGGVYAADFRVTVSNIVRGPTKQQTRYNAAFTELAVRRVLSNQATRMADTIITNVDWKGSQVAPVADTTGDGRYLAAGVGQYVVSVDNALQDGVGPQQPNLQPYNPLPTVDDASIDVEATPIDSPTP